MNDSNVIDDLNNLFESIVPSIKENVFKTRYLPLLFNINPAAFNLTWIRKVAKSPYMKVNIIDNTSNTVLFTVPPLRAASVIGATNTASNLNIIKMEMNIRPPRGNAMLENALPKLVNLGNPLHEELMAEWKVILDRYGYSDRYTQVSNVTDANSDEFTILPDMDDEW